LEIKHSKQRTPSSTTGNNHEARRSGPAEFPWQQPAGDHRGCKPPHQQHISTWRVLTQESSGRWADAKPSTTNPGNVSVHTFQPTVDDVDKHQTQQPAECVQKQSGAEAVCPEVPLQFVELVSRLSNSLAEESIPPGDVTELPADCFNPAGIFAELTDVLFGGLVKRRSVLSQRRADDEPPASDFFGAELLCKR